MMICQRWLLGGYEDAAAVAVAVRTPAIKASDVSGLLGNCIVEDDGAILWPARFTVFLEFFEVFVVILLFVPAVLDEELVEGTFALG